MAGSRAALAGTFADKTHFNSTGPDIGPVKVTRTRAGEPAMAANSFTSLPETSSNSNSAGSRTVILSKVPWIERTC